MSPSILSRALATAGLGASLLLGAAPAAALVALPPAFTGLVALGDSLSDIGRVYAASGNTFPPAPYYQGRFSNGPVAVEYLAAGLGLVVPGQFFDLAVGGAKTGLDGSAGAGTGMLSQLASLQAAAQGVVDPGALYFVWGGANDLRAQVPMAESIGNLSTIVSSLHSMGARKFLLPNLPDIGLTPEAREAGIGGLATFASVAFNQQLSAAYGALAAQWADETFYFFDAMGAQRALTNGAPGNGFSNVTEACFKPGVPSLCSNPGSYLYWDQIHPTAAAHQILGAGLLAAVPEPQSVLMMTVGLLGVLAGLRRRRG